MFVNFRQNKLQIIVSTLLGIIVYAYTLNQTLGFITTLVSTVGLRYIQLDKLIENYIYVYYK